MVIGGPGFRNVNAFDGTCTVSTAGQRLFGIFDVSSPWVDENCRMSTNVEGTKAGICAIDDPRKSVQSNLLQRMNGNMENDVDMEMSQLNGV